MFNVMTAKPKAEPKFVLSKIIICIIMFSKCNKYFICYDDL